MRRRLFLTATLSSVALLATTRVPCWAKTLHAEESTSPQKKFYKRLALTAQELEEWKLTEAEWRKRLTPEQFHILRDEGTEKPHSSLLDKEYGKGTYVCAGCALPLFESDTKFDSGTGWPSFWDYIPGHLEFKTDYKLIWPRKEYHCARCGGHQGHVFDDGPKEHTGLRYCNNGVALKFIKGS